MQADAAHPAGAWVFLGDTWLKSIYRLLVDLYQPQHHVFLTGADLNGDAADQAKARIASAGLFVRSYKSPDIAGRKADAVCPSFWIDGLASLEFQNSPEGKVLLGGKEAVAAMDSKGLAKITTLSIKAEIAFRCKERFEKSMAALQEQESVTVPLSGFILENYRHRKVLCGVDRPTPIVSVEIARQIAASTGNDLSPFRSIRHSQIGELAFKPRVSCLLPVDATALEIGFDADPFWFASLGRMLYEADKLRRQGQLRTT